MNSARRATATAVVLAASGALLGAVAPTASAATGCAAPVYTRQFFANTTFSGTPKKADCDSAVAEQWGTGAPATGLPKDNFGVRWTVTRDFGSGGPFALTAAAQDGIRVYLDGTREVDLWKNVSATRKKTVNVTVPSGRHTLRVDFVNWTGSANVSLAYTPRTSPDVDKVEPLVPAGAAVTYDSATGKAKVSWSGNKEMDLAGYRVYRRLKGFPYEAKPLATTTATTYTDATLPVTGDTYYYEVRAYDKAGNESAGTADKPLTTADRTAPGSPAALTVTDPSEKDGLRIGWSYTTGATSYRVYRAATANGTYTRLGGTGDLSYRDATAAVGTTYYYRVTAVDAAGNESARSAALAAQRRDDTPPPLVTGLKVTPTDYGFELTWDKNPAPDLHRYSVYAGRVLSDGEERVCSASQDAWLMPDETSYRYTSIPDGEERCFFVDAVDTNWNSRYQLTREANVVVATELGTPPAEGGTEPGSAG
ncbi:PA14 domain-containing protein [Streptomyces sp. NRRL B-3648]|uniref:PA14 domain-containing protein n=1 Tax=Streptomyces sp. NRRL B-3648 TaxID=1519493 RepID=UPI0006B03BFA|nr:PA14 domain-containing protein [Streptomyces sp. NRRL B-3648]KOX05220.1 cellulose 1,4-beta-cellobiosidase family protein [Streptomyces sp. NRRL B-3648]